MPKWSPIDVSVDRADSITHILKHNSPIRMLSPHTRSAMPPMFSGCNQRIAQGVAAAERGSQRPMHTLGCWRNTVAHLPTMDYRDWTDRFLSCGAKRNFAGWRREWRHAPLYAGRMHMRSVIAMSTIILICADRKETSLFSIMFGHHTEGCCRLALHIRIAYGTSSLVNLERFSRHFIINNAQVANPTTNFEYEIISKRIFYPNLV